MSKLSEDVLFLTLEELRNHRKSLYSCLLVDKTWCKTTIPILWKNPFKFCLTDNAKNIFFNVILLHLSKESKENLKNQEIDLTETHRRPLFNYISFCKYLNLHILEKMIVTKMLEGPKISIIRNEILRLFINGNTKIAHLDINSHYQLHLIPGVEHCLSELKFLRCNTNTNENILGELSRTNKSIENLEIHIDHHNNNNSGVIELIKAQKKLIDLQFICQDAKNGPFNKTLEESLIKHMGTIQCLRISWSPVTKFLLNLTNLISLDMSFTYYQYSNLNFSNLEYVFLPHLKILKASWVPSKSLASLIENTKGHLAEISINYAYDNSQRIIQSIYQNCPNLIYLKFDSVFDNSNISEFEKLLINCQCLNGLVIASVGMFSMLTWDYLLKILTKSSPTGLFKFKFHFGTGTTPTSKSNLRTFFDGWKGRHSMLLQTIPEDHGLNPKDFIDFIEMYVAKGIIKKYDNDWYNFEEFEWIERKIVK